MKTIEIKEKIDRKGGKYYYVDGKRYYTSEWYKLSRILTGTTSEDGAGIFTCRSGEVEFSYGGNSKTFNFSTPRSDVWVENEEILQQRIDQVREWINSLKKKESHIHLRTDYEP